MNKYRHLFKPKHAILAATIIFALTMISLLIIRHYDKKLRNRLLDDAYIVSAAINADGLKSLKAAESDLNSPFYQRLKKQLSNIRKSNDSYKYLYLLGIKENKETVFFFIDSLTPNSPNYVPPGEIYSEVSDEYIAALKAKTKITVGPVTDRWGTMITALIPIIDKDTGELIATLGLDTLDNKWQKTIYTQSLQPIGFIVFFVLATILFVLVKNAHYKKTEKAKEQFETIINGADLGWWDLDIPSGNEVYNEILAKNLGYKLNEIKPHIKWWEDKIYPSDSKQVLEDLQKHLDGKTECYNNKHRLKTKSGEWKWFSDYGKVVERDKAGKAIRMIGVLRNIDMEERAAQALLESKEKLRQSEEYHRTLIQNSIDAIGVIDGKGKIIFQSESAAKILGYETAERCGENIESIIHPDDKKRIMKQIAAIVPKYGLIEKMNTRAVHKDGSIRNIEGTARNMLHLPEIKGIILNYRDVTERIEANKLISKLSTAVEQTGNTIMITDIEGNIEYTNPQFTKITGYTAAEALGKNPRILNAGTQPKEYYTDMWLTIQTGEVWRGEFHNKTKKGLLYWESVVITPIKENDEIINFLAIKQDITEQKNEHEQNEQLQKQLMQSQKMESVGRLAGGVAHDFNNMLMVIIGYAEMMEQDMDKENPFLHLVKEIKTTGLRSATLTKQLLAFARKQTVATEVLNINHTISDMLKMLKRLIGENINLRWEPDDNLWDIKMGSGQIDQILANFCVNARDAIDGAGVLTIKTENENITESFHANYAEFSPGDYVKITISDNGCGMDKETQQHVFEPFFTTKKQGEGTGLGLSTVYGIVKQNQGIINICSDLGQGTTFEIYLPRHLDKTPILPDKTPEQPHARGNATVLLVEDEPMILKLVTTMLEKNGYTVVAVGIPNLALEQANSYSGDIHLLLTDVIMPDINGSELAKEISKNYPNIKCLFMSGYTDDIIAQQGVLDDDVSFISKPFSRDALIAKVQETLAQ